MTKRKSQSGHLLLVLILVLALLAIIGIGVELYSRRSAKQDLMQIIAKQATATYENIAVSDTAWPAQMGSGMPVPVPGYDFSISSQSLPSTYFTLKDKVTAYAAKSPYDIESSIEKTFTSNGYSKLYVGPTTELFINSRLPQEERCTSIYDGQQVVLTLTCYQAPAIQAAAKPLNPFVSVFTKSDPSHVVADTYFGPATIKSQHPSGVIGASKTAGYDIAEMIVAQKDDTNKLIALFYNKQGEPWKYVTEASDEFGFTCGSFMANQDIRSAMQGQICLNNSGQVRLDTNQQASQ
ncbi:MAG TPA: hypothetical protein VLG37_05125 [Candidatus Saccharimonadales bacterium]|nr:hypothetical protein [Candidatus Saccharimonadales bacterium]